MTGNFSGNDTGLWVIDAVVCKIDGDDYYVQYARVTKSDDEKTSFYLDAPWLTSQQRSDENNGYFGSCGISASLGNDYTTLKKTILKRNDFEKGWKYGNPYYDSTTHQPLK